MQTPVITCGLVLILGESGALLRARFFDTGDEEIRFSNNVDKEPEMNLILNLSRL
jgi:hypothetical protein